VLPTYNEIDNLRPLVEQVLNTGPFDVLVVDDNSPDGTGRLADELAEAYPERVSVLHRQAKEGLGRAYIAGFEWGLSRDYDVLFEMDADFSHSPSYLPQFLEEIEHGAQLVLGSRNIAGGGARNWPLVRHVISKGGSMYARLVLGVPFRDLTSGFKAFRRGVLEKLDMGCIHASGYSFQIEMTYRSHQKGTEIREIPIIFNDRTVGTSKMTGKIVLEAMLVVWKLRFTKPAGRSVRQALAVKSR
jgi:dolichol-phosphate mannosyltransferase